MRGRSAASFGLAVHQRRLYYAVAAGEQVWSVGLRPDGAFGGDARLEIEVPPLAPGNEISKIAFDAGGRMVIAERPAPLGAFDFAALTQEGIGRVLRYARMTTAWLPAPDDYAIGFPGQFDNANGGAAIGYGYDANGELDPNSCGGFLWSTGEQLRVAADPALAAQLAEGGPASVNGLQGNAIDLVRPANAPPLASYFINSDDRFDANARGHLGDVAILRHCPVASGLGVVPGAEIAGLFAGWGLSGFGYVPPPPLPPFTPRPPGAGRPTPACPTGQPGQGSQCCPLFAPPGPNGPCQSLCPSGSLNPSDPLNELACWLGLAAQQNPANWNAGAATCWNGSTPANGGVLQIGDCPMPPGAQCPIGFTQAPAQQGQPGAWTDWTCLPTQQELNCVQNGGEVGIDGACHPNLCGGFRSGSLPFPVDQCCPPGQTPDPANPGACVPPAPTPPATPPPTPPSTPSSTLPSSPTPSSISCAANTVSTIIRLAAPPSTFFPTPTASHSVVRNRSSTASVRQAQAAPPTPRQFRRPISAARWPVSTPPMARSIAAQCRPSADSAHRAARGRRRCNSLYQSVLPQQSSLQRNRRRHLLLRQRGRRRRVLPCADDADPVAQLLLPVRQCLHRPQRPVAMLFSVASERPVCSDRLLRDFGGTLIPSINRCCAASQVYQGPNGLACCSADVVGGTLAMGGNARTGIEDTLWLSKGVMAENPAPHTPAGRRGQGHRTHPCNRRRRPRRCSSCPSSTRLRQHRQALNPQSPADAGLCGL